MKLSKLHIQYLPMPVARVGTDRRSFVGLGVGAGRRIASSAWFLAVPLLLTTYSITASAHADVWFVRARATGDGTSAATPTGSSTDLDRMTRPGDVILMLPGETPFEGGVALKRGQTLIGNAERGSKPSITNTDPERNGGNGVVLADDCRILDVRIERTRGSGVLGVNVSGTCLMDVELEGSNQSAGLTTFGLSFFGRISHGAALFIAAEPGKKLANRILRSRVKNAAGMGIGAIALKGARNRLVVEETHVEGGPAIPPLFDIGVMSAADGRASEACVEMSDTVVSGRMSRQGRNVIVFASSDAKATARIERSRSGESGQDGVVGVAAMVPASVEIEIRDSTLEKAAQMNLEGTILNLPPSDPARAHESLISLDVAGCTIRDAGFVNGFRGEEQNIWIAPSVLFKRPFARGRYRLTMRDSVVEKARKGGITVGNAGSDFKLTPDEGEYEVRLIENTIRDNGPADLEIAAAKARVDARRNFWGGVKGLAEGRVILRDEARRSQLDASEPLSGPRDRHSR